jgi:glutamine synthetase
MSEITTRGELLNFVEEHEIGTMRVGAVDIDGVWRGKRIPVHYFTDSVRESGTNICNILFGWDMLDEMLPGLDYTGWHTGYPDITLKPDLSSLTVVPWEPHTASVVCDIQELDGTPVALSPRQVLRKVLHDAADLGYSASAAYEFEFYILRQSPTELHRSGFRDLEPLTHGSHTYSLQRGHATECVLEIREQLREAGIYIEACNTEHGPGQFEVNIHHGDALRAADQALMLKTPSRRSRPLTATRPRSWPRSTPRGQAPPAMSTRASGLRTAPRRSPATPPANCPIRVTSTWQGSWSSPAT